MKERCHCGQPLHYRDEKLKAMVLRLIEEKGTHIPVKVGDRTWLVQRHYIALHGLVAAKIGDLGFEEVLG